MFHSFTVKKYQGSSFWIYIDTLCTPRRLLLENLISKYFKVQTNDLHMTFFKRFLWYPELFLATLLKLLIHRVKKIIVFLKTCMSWKKEILVAPNRYRLIGVCVPQLYGRIQWRNNRGIAQILLIFEASEGEFEAATPRDAFTKGIPYSRHSEQWQSHASVWLVPSLWRNFLGISPLLLRIRHIHWSSSQFHPATIWEANQSEAVMDQTQVQACFFMCLCLE